MVVCQKFMKSLWSRMHELFWIILIWKLFIISKMDYSELFWYENFLPEAFLSTSQVDKNCLTILAGRGKRTKCTNQNMNEKIKDFDIFVACWYSLQLIRSVFWSFWSSQVFNLYLGQFFDDLKISVIRKVTIAIYFFKWQLKAHSMAFFIRTQC